MIDLIILLKQVRYLYKTHFILFIITSLIGSRAIAQKTDSSEQISQNPLAKKNSIHRPYQVSLVPEVSSQGPLSPQVSNDLSFNILGGNNGGVTGFEFGGLFNLDKTTVQYLQLAGLFNIVGGQVKGVQIAGINNTVQDSVNGFQIAGVNNFVKGSFSGGQISGVFNHVEGSFKGVQIGGVVNYVKNSTQGIQLAGVMNYSNREMRGTQISGFINYTKKLKGIQIGIINVADSSNGYSIGLLNIVKNGYHKIAFFSDEISNANIAIKTGNDKLYSILGAGYNVSKSEKVFSFGFGDGAEFRVKNGLYFNPEFYCQYLYLGEWNYVNILSKLRLNFNYHLGKNLSIFAGPSFNVYYSDQDKNIQDYRTNIPPHNFNPGKLSAHLTDWIGWNVGINLF